MNHCVTQKLNQELDKEIHMKNYLFRVMVQEVVENQPT